ncbi:Alpha/Beta hydrolase protein [Xylaria acuta]|nr:Alpha/Beta hydrolase protein [Xylaria acuta]
MVPTETRITSDLSIDAAKFDPAAVTEQTVNVKAMLERMYDSGPKWYEVGAANYRKMRDEGKTPLPPPIYLPTARDVAIPSRDAGRDIPVRICEPHNGRPSRGILLHCHGGGFVLLSHQQSDSALDRYANECQLTAMSVGYRLAPENPYPAGVNDCIDVAQYLIDYGEERFGQKLRFMTGDSAGACLAAAAAFSLMRSRPAYQLAGFLFHFGQFDVTLGLPQVSSYHKPLMINAKELQHFADAYTPEMSAQNRKDPSISPLYEDMQSLAAAAPTKKLPPALFHVGTDDPFVDENILMSAKWQITGSEAVLKFYPGSPHGFTLLGGKAAADCAATNVQFVKEKLDAIRG